LEQQFVDRVNKQLDTVAKIFNVPQPKKKSVTIEEPTKLQGN
jgi:hypothetical protein